MKWLEMTWFGSSEELSSLQIDSLGIKPQVFVARGVAHMELQRSPRGDMMICAGTPHKAVTKKISFKPRGLKLLT